MVYKDKTYFQAYSQWRVAPKEAHYQCSSNEDEPGGSHEVTWPLQNIWKQYIKHKPDQTLPLPLWARSIISLVLIKSQLPCYSPPGSWGHRYLWAGNWPGQSGLPLLVAGDLLLHPENLCYRKNIVWLPLHLLRSITGKKKNTPKVPDLYIYSYI